MTRSLRVLLGVSGGIAAFKAAELVRLLRGGGHEVRCALTAGAEAFVAPLTLEVLSGHHVHRQEYLTATGGGAELHLELAEWADVLVVAPATAHLLARLALGLADDFLLTVALMHEGPLVVAPAMHPRMWFKAAVQENVTTLERRGVVRVGPVEGPLASGATGMGRMAEPSEIVAAVEASAGRGPWRGRCVVVTAGPTREFLDPVRFLSNRSSGKMGFAVAAEAARRGARTLLVAGPVSLATPPGVERVDVSSAEEMLAAVVAVAKDADLVVMAAAVADFRPAERAERKLKKRDGVPALELRENPDILRELARIAPDAVRVGFAAETDDLAAAAAEKLAAKDVDFLVANDVSRQDIGFEVDANEVTVYRRRGDPVALSRRPKAVLAGALLELFAEAWS